jgi:hypothetical protein
LASSAFLVWAATAKLTSSALEEAFAQGSSAHAAYVLAAAGELILAALLLFGPTATYGAMMTACGFLGAGVVVGAQVIGGTAPATCACLGSPSTSRGVALVVQGALIVVAAAVYWIRGGRTPSAARRP